MKTVARRSLRRSRRTRLVAPSRINIVKSEESVKSEKNGKQTFDVFSVISMLFFGI